MRLPRSSGILLHPTSLPGRWGIGDLGAEARRFVDVLAAARVGLWQVLPLGPTGFGNSPYQCFSAFAGNPLLVSPEALLEDGLLHERDFGSTTFPDDHVDYGAVIPWKEALLRAAAERFRGDAGRSLRAAFDAFCDRERDWLHDYALFMALKDAHAGADWNTWDPDVARRMPAALDHWRARLAAPIEAQQFRQFMFFRQWDALRGYAAERGVRFFGDMPIFVARNSADVWAHPELFYLDGAGRPTIVAGVPPDYFSETGQLWGNPLYRWDVMAAHGHHWWIERFRTAFELFDVVRVDHFIGFARYWAVPADATTAVHGEWRPGPGMGLATAVRAALGTLPIVAEDLGIVTPEVDELRERLALPGMKVLQFAFGGGADNRFLPHNYTPNYVVYTGTHDNDTTEGWFAALAPDERARVARFVPDVGDAPAWSLIRLAMASVADTAVIPMQDVLALGSDARMNLPGRAEDNWGWRLPADAIGADHVRRLRELVELFGRASG